MTNIAYTKKGEGNEARYERTQKETIDSLREKEAAVSLRAERLRLEQVRRLQPRGQEETQPATPDERGLGSRTGEHKGVSVVSPDTAKEKNLFGITEGKKYKVVNPHIQTAIPLSEGEKAEILSHPIPTLEHPTTEIEKAQAEAKARQAQAEASKKQLGIPEGNKKLLNFDLPIGQRVEAITDANTYGMKKGDKGAIIKITAKGYEVDWDKGTGSKDLYAGIKPIEEAKSTESATAKTPSELIKQAVAGNANLNEAKLANIVNSMSAGKSDKAITKDYIRKFGGAKGIDEYIKAARGIVSKGKLAKGGINAVEFKHEFGYEPERLTGSEIQQYILNGANGIKGLRSRFATQGGAESLANVTQAQRAEKGVTYKYGEEAGGKVSEDTGKNLGRFAEDNKAEVEKAWPEVVSIAEGTLTVPVAPIKTSTEAATTFRDIAKNPQEAMYFRLTSGKALRFALGRRAGRNMRKAPPSSLNNAGFLFGQHLTGSLEGDIVLSEGPT